MHRVEFREKLFSQGETVRLGVHPEALAEWGERKPVFADRGPLACRDTTLAVLWILSLVVWGVWGLGACRFGHVDSESGLGAPALHAPGRSGGAVEKAAEDLECWPGCLLLEQEIFSRQAGRAAGRSQARWDCAFVAIRRLARVVEYFSSRGAICFCGRFDIFTFWSAQLVFAAERWQRSLVRHSRLAEGSGRVGSADGALRLCV
jgi:hypothetical protein